MGRKRRNNSQTPLLKDKSRPGGGLRASFCELGGLVALRGDRLLHLHPVIDFLLSLFLSVAITLLQKTAQFFLLTADAADIIVRQFCPLLLRLAFKLRPIALDLIPIHCFVLLICDLKFYGSTQWQTRDAYTRFHQVVHHSGAVGP